MKRNYKLKPIKNIIESFVEQDSISDGIFNIKIQKAWENAVEKKINEVIIIIILLNIFKLV